MGFQLTTQTPDDSEHVGIMVHISGDMTWEIYDAEMQRLSEVCKTYNKPVYIILTSDAEMPSGNAFRHFVNTFELFRTLPNFRLMISVYPMSILTLRLIIAALARIYGQSWQNRFPVVKTVEEAESLIKSDRNQK